MCKREIRYIATTGFVHRQVAGNDILISVGANVANFNGCITLNPVASFLWDALAQPQSIGTLVDLLTEEFDVTQEKAKNDVENFLEMLLHHSMVSVYEER
jgi:hypothetical protein